MSIKANYFLGAIAIGIGANLVMDLWNLFLKRTFSIPSLDYCLLGRWLRHTLSANMCETLTPPEFTVEEGGESVRENE